MGWCSYSVCLVGYQNSQYHWFRQVCQFPKQQNIPTPPACTPPCFIVGTSFFSLKAAFGFRQTRFSLWPKHSILVLSTCPPNLFPVVKSFVKVDLANSNLAYCVCCFYEYILLSCHLVIQTRPVQWYSYGWFVNMWTRLTWSSPKVLVILGFLTL